MPLPDTLPAPPKRNMALHVKPAAERALRDGHPWLYEEAIRDMSFAGEAGNIAVIFDSKDRFLAVGLYDPDSAIRVKVLQANDKARVNADFFRARLQTAIERRQPLHTKDTNGYRLVYGEGDGFPGLIIDRYADVFVMKLYSAIWLPYLRDILTQLTVLLPSKNVVLRLSRNLQDNDTHGLHEGMILAGNLDSDVITFTEHGLLFGANVIDGHKTGFFFDQRDNRQRVRGLSAGKTVLDVFSYNGGFSVNAAMGGAKHVTSVDISEPALKSAQANMARNQHHQAVANCEHAIMAKDAFEALTYLAIRKQTFDLVIVDPPTFASKQSQVDGALQAYHELVSRAVEVVKKGGTLVMASCSSRVPADTFFSVVHNAASRAGRPLSEFDRTQHALDHPVTFPEGAYLKCLYATL